MHIIRTQTFIVFGADVDVVNRVLTHACSLRRGARARGFHRNRPDDGCPDNQQRCHKPQAAVKAAGHIFQPADHKRTERRSNIAGGVDHRDTDRSGTKAD